MNPTCRAAGGVAPERTAALVPTGGVSALPATTQPLAEHESPEGADDKGPAKRKSGRVTAGVHTLRSSSGDGEVAHPLPFVGFAP